MAERIRDENGHEWVAIATYSLKASEARASAAGVVNLDDNAVEWTGPVCYRCEQDMGAMGDTCPGEGAIQHGTG